MSRESIFTVFIFHDIILFTQTSKLRLPKYFFVCLLNILFHCFFFLVVVPSQLIFHHFHKLFYYTNIKVKSWHFKYVIHYIFSIHSLTVRLFLYNILIYIIVYEIKHLVSFFWVEFWWFCCWLNIITEIHLFVVEFFIFHSIFFCVRRGYDLIVLFM